MELEQEYLPKETERGPDKAEGQKDKFAEFIKLNQVEVEKVKKEYPEVTKGGIITLIRLLFRFHNDKNIIFAKLRNVLDVLLPERFKKNMATYKASSEKIQKSPPKQGPK